MTRDEAKLKQTNEVVASRPERSEGTGVAMTDEA